MADNTTTMIGVLQPIVFCNRHVRTILDTHNVRWFVVADFQDIFLVKNIFEVIGQELEGEEKLVWFFPERRVCVNTKGLEHLQHLVDIRV